MAEATAEASVKTFVIGVRPHGKGWFANCDGVEFDGSTVDQAVRSVAQKLHDDLAHRSAMAQREREQSSEAAQLIERALASDDTRTVQP